MLFRGSDDPALLTWPDDLLHLSEFMQNLHREHSVEQLLADALKKSNYAAQAPAFIAELEGCQLTDLLEPTSLLCQKLRGLANMANVLQYVQQHADNIFESRIFTLKFVKSQTLRRICELVHLPYENGLHEHMFDDLFLAAQGLSGNGSIKNLIDPSLHVFVDFMAGIDHTDLMHMMKAAATLGLPWLSKLLGFEFWNRTRNMTETQIRQSFQVPENKRNAVNEKLRQIMASPPWADKSGASSSSTRSKPPKPQ